MKTITIGAMCCALVAGCLDAPIDENEASGSVSSGCDLIASYGYVMDVQVQAQCTETYLYMRAGAGNYSYSAFCPDTVTNRYELTRNNVVYLKAGTYDTCLTVAAGQLFAIFDQPGPGCPVGCGPEPY